MLQSFWMLVAAFFFATMTALVKINSGDAGTFEIVFYRSFVSLAFIYLMIVARGGSIRTKYFGGHMKRSVLGTVSFTLWFSTMGHLPLGTATTLNYTAPLFIAATMIATALWKRQRAPWMLGIAIFFGFAGVCLVLQPSLNPEELPWALVGLTAGAMGPVIFFQIKQLGALHEPSERIVFYFSLFGTLMGLAGACLFEGGLKMHSMQTFGTLAAVGVVGVIAQVCLTRAYAYGNMMLTACFQFATIPFAETISYFFFDESLPATALTGMVLILVAGSSASIITRKMEHARAAGAKRARVQDAIDASRKGS